MKEERDARLFIDCCATKKGMTTGAAMPVSVLFYGLS